MTTINKPANPEIRAWHREPMVWMVIAIPGTAVLVGVAMLIMAILSWDGLVVDDYYKRGKEINRVLTRDKVAADQGINARVTIDTTGSQFTVLLDADNIEYLQTTSPGPLRANIVHPTRSGYDQEILLTKSDANTYVGQLSPLQDGHWIVHIQSEKWRLVREVDLPHEGQIQFMPTMRQ